MWVNKKTPKDLVKKGYGNYGFIENLYIMQGINNI